MHTKLLENYSSIPAEKRAASADLLGTKAMYHAINRVLCHIKKEISSQPNATFRLTLEGTRHTLLLEPEGEIVASTGSAPQSLARILFINWDSLRSRATRFDCLTIGDESAPEGTLTNKTLGFFQALGAPIPHGQD